MSGIQSTIEYSPYYVTMTDKFLSGWGESSGKPARYVALCESLEEACVVFENAKARGDQRSIKIVNGISSAGSKIMTNGGYRVMSRETSENWYKPGHFALQKAMEKAKKSGLR